MENHQRLFFTSELQPTTECLTQLLQVVAAAEPHRSWPDNNCEVSKQCRKKTFAVKHSSKRLFIRIKTFTACQRLGALKSNYHLRDCKLQTADHNVSHNSTSLSQVASRSLIDKLKWWAVTTRVRIRYESHRWYFVTINNYFQYTQGSAAYRKKNNKR